MAVHIRRALNTWAATKGIDNAFVSIRPTGDTLIEAWKDDKKIAIFIGDDEVHICDFFNHWYMVRWLTFWRCWQIQRYWNTGTSWWQRCIRALLYITDWQCEVCTGMPAINFIVWFTPLGRFGVAKWVDTPWYRGWKLDYSWDWG